MYLLGIDLGTTGCKSMLFDKNGTILGGDYIEYELIITEEGIEQDAGAWWSNVARTVKNTLTKAGVDGSKVEALSISSQGIAFVPIDSKGNTLYNAISWLDGRSVSEAEQVRQKIGIKELFRQTGKLPLPCYVLPQLMWLKNNRPVVYENTYKVLMAHDYIVYRLTGKTVTDLSMASGTLAYDIHKQDWMPHILEQFGIDIDKFPELKVMGDVAGTVLPDVAKDLGLSERTKVVIGAQDQRCASIGAGIDKGVFTISLGTSSAIGAICNQPIIDEDMKVTCCGLDKNRWILETVVSTAGVSFKWLKNTLFSDLDFQEADILAQEAKPLSGGLQFFPHLSEDNKGRANGAFMGLSLKTSKQDIIRSVLEGVAFQMKIHILSMEKLGVRGDEIRLFGGGAKSDIWCQIISDITGKRVVVPRTHETANLGAAIIAGVGVGMSDDPLFAQRMIGESKKAFVPGQENVKLYGEAFSSYMENNEKIIKRNL